MTGKKALESIIILSENLNMKKKKQQNKNKMVLQGNFST